MHIHFIVHESYEGAGAFEKWVINRGFKQSSTHLYQQEQLPTDISFDLLVILGGPQSPLTTIDECAYFNVQQETHFIKKCITAGKAVVGVCLGAQLIGEALGAKFERSPQKEIGYFPINLTETGRKNNLFSHFQGVELVGHWHNDMPGLLATSKILAYSEACPRQIIEYSELVYGFQCHLEFTEISIQELIDSAFNTTLLKNQNWVQNPTDIMETKTTNMNNLLFSFLDALRLKYQSTLRG